LIYVHKINTFLPTDCTALRNCTLFKLVSVVFPTDLAMPSLKLIII